MSGERVVKFLIFSFVLFSLSSFVYSVFGSVDFSRVTLSSLFYDLGILSGLIGFFCLSFLIISGDTSRFFDRFFGMDRIIKFQRWFAKFTFVFVILHPTFFILSSNSMASYLLPQFSVIPIAVGTFALYIFIAVSIASVFYKRVSYRAWQYLHILTYVLFFMAFYHAVNMGSASLLKGIIFGILTLVIILGIIYRTAYKIRHIRSSRFIVDSVVKEIDNVSTVILKPKRNLNFKAGQFFFLRIDKNKLYARHPFTCSSSPHENQLSFTIKREGRFTETAFNLKEGDKINVEGPFGRFHLNEENSKRNLVFIAGGVGITPFLSILKDIIHRKKRQNVTLLYSSRRRNEIIAKNFIDGIKEAWFKKTYIITRKDLEESSEYHKGYLTKSLIKKSTEDISNTTFLICGPENLKKSAVTILKELGVKSSEIKYEDFFW